MEINITEIINVCWKYIQDAYNLAISNVNAWMPTATSILSIGIFVIVGILKLKKAANDLRSDKTIRELKKLVVDDLNVHRQYDSNIQKLIDKLYKIRRRDDENNGDEDQ